MLRAKNGLYPRCVPRLLINFARPTPSGLARLGPVDDVSSRTSRLGVTNRASSSSASDAPCARGAGDAGKRLFAPGPSGQDAGDGAREEGAEFARRGAPVRLARPCYSPLPASPCAEGSARAVWPVRYVSTSPIPWRGTCHASGQIGWPEDVREFFSRRDWLKMADSAATPTRMSGRGCVRTW
jgi:hypothetical protein